MHRSLTAALLCAIIAMPATGNAYSPNGYGSPLYQAIAHAVIAKSHLGTPLANRSVHQQRVDEIFQRDAMPGKPTRYYRPQHQASSWRAQSRSNSAPPHRQDGQVEASERPFAPHCRSYNKSIRKGAHVMVELRRTCLQPDGSWRQM